MLIAVSELIKHQNMNDFRKYVHHKGHHTTHALYQITVILNKYILVYDYYGVLTNSHGYRIGEISREI